MKAFSLIVITMVIYATAAFPQTKEGQAFSQEVISQAFNTMLLPENAHVVSVDSSQQIAVMESIPIGQRVDVKKLLVGIGVPHELSKLLQEQIDRTGH